MAASAGAIKAGRAYVELVLNDRLSRGLKLAEKKLQAFGAGLRRVGARLMGVSAALATPFVAGAKVFADFEQQMAAVSTMLDNPAAHMDRFRSAVRRMSVEFGESTEALAGGLYDILSASVPAEKALDVLAASVRAAKAGMTDTKTAADAITTILNAYGLEAEAAGQVSDVLFSVVKRGKTTFGQLAPQIGMVASTAASAGVGLDELGAALATLTRAGVKTENAVTAVNQIIMTFLKPSKEAADTARRLGFEMSVATLQGEGLAGVFERIARLNPQTIAALFPNVRALRGVIPALKNLEGFLGDVERMRTGAGATEEAYRKMTATLGHAFAQLKASGAAALSVVGEALAEPLARAAAQVKRFAGAVIEWLSANKDVVRAIAKVVAVVGAVGTVLVVAGVGVTALGAALGGLASIAGVVGSALSAVLAVLGAIVSPIGLVITAVAALGAYFLHASGAMGKAVAWLKEKFSALADFTGRAFEGIKDALAAGDVGLAARILWLSLKLAWQKGVGWLKTIWADFKGWFLKIATDAFYGVQALWVKLASHVKRVWHETMGTVKTVFAAFKGIGQLKFMERRHKREAAEITARYERGEITAEAYEAEKKAFLERVRRERQAVIDATDARLAGIDEEQKARVQAVEAQRKEELAGISQKHREALDAIESEHDAAVAATKDELDEARDAWEKALAEARRKREALEAGEGPEGPGELAEPKDFLSKVKTSLSGLGDTIQRAAERTVGVRGTFSAMEAWGLGAGGVTDRITKASEETAKNTRRLVTEAQMGGLTFE